MTTPNTLESVSTNVVELTEDNLDAEVLNIKWLAEKPAINVLTKSAIQIDVEGNNFADAKILDETNEYSYSVIGSMLNNFLGKQFLQKPETTVNYEIRIVTVAKGKDNVSAFLPETASTSQTISITTTNSAPANLYMIGEEFGDWTWTDPNIVSMTPVNGKDGEFWCVRYISAGKGFKWSVAKDWDSENFAELKENNGYILKDGNAAVESDGMYSIYIDYMKGKITIEPATVYGIGDCVGDWDMGTHPLAISNKTMTLTATGTGELRLYANSTASSIGGDWWRMEFILLNNGKIEYRGNGDDQERTIVNTGQTVTLDFNAGIGTIQ